MDICRYFSIGHYRHFSPGHQGSSRESWSLPASRHTVPLQIINIFAMLCQIRILYHFIVCQAFLFVKRFSLESELDQEMRKWFSCLTIHFPQMMFSYGVSCRSDSILRTSGGIHRTSVSTQAQATGLRGGRDVWCFHPRPSSKRSR